MAALENAEKLFGDQLTTGRVVIHPDTQQVDLNFKQDETDQLRRLASACHALADALEDQGTDCEDRMPTEDDANAVGDVEWLRSGVWMRGRIAAGPPVDATRWRRLPDGK